MVSTPYESYLHPTSKVLLNREKDLKIILKLRHSGYTAYVETYTVFCHIDHVRHKDVFRKVFQWHK